MWLECLIVGSLIYLATVYSKFDMSGKKTSQVDITLQPIHAMDFLMADSKEVPIKSYTWWGTANDVADMKMEDSYTKGVKEGEDGQFVGDFGSANSRFYDRVNKDM